MQSEDDGGEPEIFGLPSCIGPGLLLWVTIFLWLALLPARISSIPQCSFPGASGVHSPVNYRDAVVGKRWAVKHGTTLG